MKIEERLYGSFFTLVCALIRFDFRAGLVALVMLGICDTSRAEQRLPTLQDVTAAYEKHHLALRSLLVQGEERSTPLIPMEDLIRFGVFPMGQSDETLCIKGKKIYCRVIIKRRSMDAVMNDLHREDPNINNIPDAIGKLSPAVFLRRLEAKPIETSERILVYDGSSLHEKLPTPIFYKDEKRDSYNIMNLASVENPYLPHTYFNWICYAPELPDGDNRADHIPRMFDAATFSISQNLDRVDGMECIVLEAKDYQKLWLDPSLGFAVRQREFFHQKMLTKQEHCSDFVEVVPGVWLPRQVDRYIIGVPMMASLPNAFRGKKLVQITYRVVRFETNKDSHDSLFILTPKAGSFVSDERLSFLDTSGKPIKAGKRRKVSYIQPADPADLQRVIQMAQQSSDVAPGRERGNPHQRYLLAGVAVGLLVALAGLTIWRIWRTRRDRTAS